MHLQNFINSHKAIICRCYLRAYDEVPSTITDATLSYMRMGRSIYIIFSLQVYFLALCEAEDVVYGIFENGSFKMAFDEAMRNLNKSTSANFLQLNHNQSLNQLIASSQQISSTSKQKSRDNMFVFSDLNHVKNGIMREVLVHHRQNLKYRNTTLYIDNAFGLQPQV